LCQMKWEAGKNVRLIAAAPNWKIAKQGLLVKKFLTNSL